MQWYNISFPLFPFKSGYWWNGWTWSDCSSPGQCMARNAHGIPQALKRHVIYLGNCTATKHSGANGPILFNPNRSLQLLWVFPWTAVSIYMEHGNYHCGIVGVYLSKSECAGSVQSKGFDDSDHLYKQKTKVKVKWSCVVTYPTHSRAEMEKRQKTGYPYQKEADFGVNQAVITLGLFGIMMIAAPPAAN